MRAWSLLMVAGALLTPNPTHGQAGGPLETAVKFLEARAARPCREVWDFYSAGTQENIRAAEHRRQRDREGAPQAEQPEQRVCRYPGELRRGSARIARQQGNEAVIAADFTVKEVTDRNFFPRFVKRTEELRLIQEAGAWRVELPRIRIELPKGLVEVGPVDVSYQPSGNLGRDRLEATAVMRAPRDILVAALRDPKAWARALPSVDTVQVLERAGEKERVQLTFAGVDRSITVAVTSTGEPRDPNMYVTSALWEVEGGSKAPVYLRGSWRLQPYPDGTRVSLVLFFNPREWPANPAEGIFSPERMAQAVLGLEKSVK